MAIIQGVVGPQQLAAGANAAPSQTNQGGLVVQDEHGRYYEMTKRGGVYTAIAAAVTLAATNVSPLAANTGVPILGLWNPPSSGFNLVVTRAKMQTTSGTPAGPFYWNVIANTAITAAFTKGINNKTLAQGGVACVFANVAITGSTVGIPFRTLGGPANVAAGAGIYSFEEEAAGDIIIQPGCFAGFAAKGAGTAHIVDASITWEEVSNAA